MVEAPTASAAIEPPDGTRRVAAAVALLAMTAAIVALVIGSIRSFPTGILLAAAAVLCVVVGVEGLRRRGPWRLIALGVGVGGIVAVVAAAVVLRVGAAVLIAIALVPVGGVAARRAFAARGALASAPAPKHPVVIWNPRSGGDGTQALVATIAAREGLPFACIPAGTRNHFALDLGVDRDDVVGALDAFVDGRERVVDLAEVNGRVFVNNASLGVYAEAVQRESYRGAKASTLLDTIPDAFGRGADGPALRWSRPDGSPGPAAAVLLVSNNPYRLGTVVGSGTRPGMDDATLGIVAVGAGLTRWEAPEFVVDSDGPVPIGVDGEGLVMDPPLVFRSRPAALRVRIARQHPGASPSSDAPIHLRSAGAALWRIATGRPGRPRP